MTAAALRRSFEDQKAEGTAIEWLAVDLFAANGWCLYPTQIHWDAAGRRRAARMYGPDGRELPVPDLDGHTPAPLSQRVGLEIKPKLPRRLGGGFSWDTQRFRDAERWQELTGAPVLYVVRDRSIAPVPTRRDELDALEPWFFASLHQLRAHQPEVFIDTTENEDGERRHRAMWCWPREVFAPLSELLDGGFVIAPALLRPVAKMRFGAGRLL